jgi:hypothetical protein
MTSPTINPLAWVQLPFTNFLKTWNFVPRTQWLDHFITINNNGNDAPVEQHVLSEVGSYGKQLSDILDALEVVIAHVAKIQPFDAEEAVPIDALKKLHAATKDSVTRFRNNPAAYQSGLLGSLVGA